MTRFRMLSPLAALLAAASFSVPAAAAPATGPDRYFTGSDLFNLEVATDPQISPDGRTIAYVRKSNDIMTDKARADDLAGRRRNRSTAPARSRLGILFLAALVARRNAPRLRRRRRRRAAAVRALDGERDQCAHHRPARQPRHDRLVARRPPHRIFDVRARRGDAPRLRPAQAGRREMGRPARDHQRGHLPLRRRRLFQARLHPDLLGSGRRGGADAADLRSDQRRRRTDRLDSDSRSVLFSANMSKDWERELNESEISASASTAARRSRSPAAKGPTALLPCRPMAG